MAAGRGVEKPCVLPELPELKVGGFQGVDEWLPPLRPKIRVALSSELGRAWGNEARVVTGGLPSVALRPATKTDPPRRTAVRQHSEMNAKLAERLEQYREDVFKRNGLWLPDVTFARATSDLVDDRKLQFRMAVLDAEDREGLD